MTAKTETATRVFKTAWFSKAASKARISDAALCAAIKQAMQGQAVDLGGGVFKKRLNENRHRSILITKAGQYWIYAYLFAKKDRDNIGADELAEFKKLAALYSRQTSSIFDAEVKQGSLLEICHAEKDDL